jgi:hypothetical protein
MVVEQPGTEAGMPCVEVARKQSPITETGPSTISCGGEGFCTELRPCQLRCEEISGAKDVVEATSTTGDNAHSSSSKSCGDTFWSSCDYKCNQTRIRSLLFSDGQCHELERKIRPCHTDACGRSDPCRVPFIVHSIYLLRGVTAWSKKDDDIFAEALARSFRLLRPTGPDLFEVGDVKVILARPWVAGDDVESFASLDCEDCDNEELGLKVVVQISIFNPNAQIRGNGGSGSSPSKTGGINLNGTARSQKTAPSLCKDSDLFSLAKNARMVAYVIPEYPDFMAQLIRDISSLTSKNGHLQNSTFLPLFQVQDFAQQSRLESSWTIRTDVDDEINYFGPPEPIFFTFLRYVHRIALVTFCCSLFVFMWGIAVQSMDFVVGVYNSARAWLPRYRGNGAAYQHLYAADMDSSDDFNSIEEKRTNAFEKSSIRRRSSIGRGKSDTSLGDSMSSIELTVVKAGLTGSTPKKRRNSGADGESTAKSPCKGWQLNHQMSV